MFLNDPCNGITECNDRIETRYKVLVDSIMSISDSVLPTTGFRPYLKPYWDVTLKHLHAVMLQKRRNWITDGRPRGHNYLSDSHYKTSKRLFRTQDKPLVEQYLIEVNAEIDQAAEMNSSFFLEKESIPEDSNPTLTLAAKFDLMAKPVETLSKSPLSGWLFLEIVYRECIARF